MERKQQRNRIRIAATDPQLADQVYSCSQCGNELFDTDKKFDSRTGFPSFWMHIGNQVAQKQLSTYGRERTQLLCQRCGQHLGHLFPNKQTPTKVRYCINASAIELTEVED